MLSSRSRTGAGPVGRIGLDWRRKSREKCDRSCLGAMQRANICAASGLIVLAYTPVFP